MPSMHSITFNYPIEERDSLLVLLHEWKMGFFFQKFIGKKFNS